MVKQLPHPLMFAASACAIFLLGACKPQSATAAKPPEKADDHELVMSLLDENLSKRTFAFATVAEVCSGKRVLPLDDSAMHRQVVTAIGKTVAENLSKIKAFPPRIPPINSVFP